VALAESFAQLLRRFRVAASLTQEALAERCRLSPAAIAAIEQGRRKAPRLSTVRLIAEALELSPADLETLARAAADRGADGSAAISMSAAGAAPGGPVTGQVAGLYATRTSFIGRDREQARVLAALAGNRSVTMVGPGGVGKTRLAGRVAEEAAARYPFGAVFADLVPVREGFLTQAVAALLGVTERPGRSLDSALLERLGQGASLLVLDNCEHLLEVVAAFVEKLLANCDDLTVLATSRERLAIPGECTITIPPLSLVAGSSEAAAGSEAAALFIDRARASDPEFAASPAVVADVCARLDGMPLAIELAAVRTASLGADGLIAGLDDHLRLLAGSRGPQERHRSLRAVIDWSHDLLDADERTMFRRAGVFAGGFDLAAAAAICPESNRGMVADLIGRLTDKSLLIHRRGPEASRWQMLETIRAYALDRLVDSGEETAVLDAHLRWAVSAASDLERRVEAGQEWRPAFDTVADDLRAALARAPRAATGEGTDDPGHRLARILGHLTFARRFMLESCEHYRTAANRASWPGLAAHDLRNAADVAIAAGQGNTAFELLLASAEQARAAGDGSSQAVSLAYAVTVADRFVGEFTEEIPQHRLRQLLDEAAGVCPPEDLTGTAYLTTAAAWIAGPEKSVPDPALSSDALAAARATADPVLITGALDAVVGALDAGGRLREAHQVNSERARLLERLPRHDPRAAAEVIDTFHMVTEVAVAAGDLPDALATARMAQDDDIAGGQPHRAASKSILPLVLQGRFDEAMAQGARMWEAWVRAGRPAARWMGPATYGMVLACGLRGDGDGQRDWLARVGELIGNGIPKVRGTNLAAAEAFITARIALHAGQMGAALAAVDGYPGEARSWYDTPHWYSMRPYAWAIAAEVAVAAGLPDAASRLAAAGLAGDENYWASACLARVAGRLHSDRDALERSVVGWELIDARFERACTLMLLPDRSAEGLAELRALGSAPPAGWLPR
jgi:predicted ATPase/DNA-binding XRE family transcriptional regulator